jgi:hypothetical protein
LLFFVELESGKFQNLNAKESEAFTTSVSFLVALRVYQNLSSRQKRPHGFFSEKSISPSIKTVLSLKK